MGVAKWSHDGTGGLWVWLSGHMMVRADCWVWLSGHMGVYQVASVFVLMRTWLANAGLLECVIISILPCPQSDFAKPNTALNQI